MATWGTKWRENDTDDLRGQGKGIIFRLCGAKKTRCFSYLKANRDAKTERFGTRDGDNK